MKGFTAFLLLVLLALNLWNARQLQQLQAQVASLQNRVQQTQNADASLTDLFNRALPLLNQAREAVKQADFDRARKLLSETTDRVNQVSHAVGDKSAPVVSWLRQQARSLEAQMDKK